MPSRNGIGLARAALLWLTALLWACTSAPGPATPTQTAAPPLTPTPAPSPTPPPTADATAEAYLAAWQQADFGAMYTLLAPESQAAVTAADFEQLLRSNLITMTVSSLTATLTSLTNNADSAQAQIHLAYETRLVGMLETDIGLPLKRSSDGSWGVVFDPAQIWPELVNGQQLYMVPFTPDRGLIYDRNGIPMAAVADVYSVGWVPSEVVPEQEETVFTGLSRLTGVAISRLEAQYQTAVPGQYIPLSEAPAADVEGRYSYLLSLPGVYLYAYNSRYYYGNGDAAHITGYTSPLQPDELEAYLARGYARDQRVGRSGLERWGESILAGQNGGQLVLLDAAGNPLKQVTPPVQAVDGQDIHTTVDFELQQAVQFALGDLTGAAVVLSRDTGEVLAMASSPTYDPNWFDSFNYNRIALGQYFSDPREPLINRAAQSSYPAGSVFKVVTMAAGLTSGLFTPEAEYTCTGQWSEIPGLVLDDWKEEGHGPLTLTEGLSASCNPWFYHVGYALHRFNPKWLSDVARAFGLGQATGIAEIDESPGLIPDPDWKLQAKGEAWEPLDSINSAIGQGDVLVTPLQIARLMAAVGNGGKLLRPQLVREIRPPEGEPTYSFARVETGDLPLTADQLAALREGLHNVTQEPIGTARNRFRGLRISVAGKTGTAEDPGLFGEQEPHSWFAGYTFSERSDRPDIAIAVVIDNQGQGSDFAAPIFRRIVESYFGLPLTRYPWESSVGVVATPEPTPSGETETPTPAP